MTKHDIEILKKFRTKKEIGRHELLTIDHLEKMKLIKVDTLYSNTINEVTINYAQTTDIGLSLIDNLDIDEKPKRKKFLFIF